MARDQQRNTVTKSAKKKKEKKEKKPRTDRRVDHAKKILTETPEQKDAFEQYFLMGDNRSYRQLAKKLNKGVTTISGWAKKFDWQERIVERDKQVDEIIEQRNNKTMAELREEQAKLLDLALESFMEKVSQGKMEIESWQDYQRVWDIRQEIGNKASRTQSNALSVLVQSIDRVAKTIESQNQDDDE